MKRFRIKIYLKIIIFFKSLFGNRYDFKKIDQLILSQSKKKYLTYTSQLRSSFLLVLLYLKSKYRNKNEIIILYNFINICETAKIIILICKFETRFQTQK